MSIAASEGEPERLERNIWLRCRSGDSNAWVGSGSDGYAFPGHRKGRARVEKATVSQTLEVGRLVSRGNLCWFSAPCPGCLSPGRAWGAYRSWTAPFTARNRPANSSSLTTLGGAARGYGGPPSGAVSCDATVCPYTVSTRQGKPWLLFRACRYSSGLIRRGLCGLWRCCLHLMLRRYCRFFRLKALRDMHGGGYDPEVLKELRTAPDLAPRATKVMARSLGRAMSTLVVQERHLWLCLVDIGTPTKFGSLRFLYPRLAFSATQPVTWPSSSRLHRSRLRRSNTSCLGGQLLPPPVRRLQRPASSSPRAALQKRCRRARCRQAAPPVLAPVYWLVSGGARGLGTGDPEREGTASGEGKCIPQGKRWVTTNLGSVHLELGLS